MKFCPKFTDAFVACRAGEVRGVAVDQLGGIADVGGELQSGAQGRAEAVPAAARHLRASAWIKPSPECMRIV